jgi:hypothetical protein
MAHRIITMGPELGELALEIVRWVDDYFPGIVACEFVDADSRRHSFVGKLPIYSTDMSLCSSSLYPQRGGLRCTVLARWTDTRGRELLRITTAEPDGECSTEGLEEFVVLGTQVSRIARGHRERNSQGYWVWVEDE